MTLTAPTFADLNLSDPDELMQVTNNTSKPITWDGTSRRTYSIPPKQSVPIPFHVCVKYMGDPRSDYKKTESYKTPDGKIGVIPAREAELRRLSINYGLYQGKIKDLPKVAPKVTILTFNGVELEWPIKNPKARTYRYDTIDSRGIDVRTELERLQAQISALEGRQTALNESAALEDPESTEAPEDTVPGG